jgi:hypothetical protein
MKTCVGCKYAKWDRTKSGRLHPSGLGECLYEFKLPKIPVCIKSNAFSTVIKLSINRRRSNDDHCAYYLRDQTK